jgi:hypothetical protein
MNYMSNHEPPKNILHNIKSMSLLFMFEPTQMSIYIACYSRGTTIHITPNLL